MHSNGLLCSKSSYFCYDYNKNTPQLCNIHTFLISTHASTSCTKLLYETTLLFKPLRIIWYYNIIILIGLIIIGPLLIGFQYHTNRNMKQTCNLQLVMLWFTSGGSAIRLLAQSETFVICRTMIYSSPSVDCRYSLADMY